MNSIDLSFKNLEKLDSTLSNYLIVNLQGNNFKGEQTLTNVQHLNLSYNNLEQMWVLPPTLITLEINNNLLQAMPNIQHLCNLKQIDVSNNLITSTHWFVNLQGLTHLYLKNNKIKSLDNIHKLQNLQELDLECNEIKSAQELQLLDHSQNIQIINVYGNPVYDELRLKNLNVIEKQCYCKTQNTYSQSELAKKRQQLQDDFDLSELDTNQKKTKSLSPLTKITGPQFYDPKASKFLTFQELFKQRQKDQKNQNNTTINNRQDIEQLKQQNKELKAERYKWQSKLQLQAKQHDQEMEEIQERLQNILHLLGVQPQAQLNCDQMLSTLEEEIIEMKKQSTTIMNCTVSRLMQKIKIMNNNIGQELAKKQVEYFAKTQHLEAKLTRLFDYVAEQKQIIIKLSKQRVHSPQMRQCMTSRHSKQASEIDQQKLKNLFFKSPHYLAEKPLKTQGNSQQMVSVDMNKYKKS